LVPRRKVGNPTPAYFKLQKQLQDEIESGRLAPQERVPPERRLAELHKVSIGTVTKAILNLVNQGYLYRVQGSGTFVAGKAFDITALCGSSGMKRLISRLPCWG
jgi:DNA-binding GntR family transcriptional regulator